jgi:hypothetical protein
VPYTPRVTVKVVPDTAVTVAASQLLLVPLLIATLNGVLVGKPLVLATVIDVAVVLVIAADSVVEAVAGADDPARAHKPGHA